MQTMAEYTAIATSASELSNLLTSDKFGVYPASAYLKCDGVTDDYQALYDLINTTINGASAEVWIKGIVFINENITIPKNIKFKFQNGGMFKIALGKTMTGAYAKLEADIQQIFDLSLVGSVAGNWDVVEVYPEWFGVDKSASNNSAKTQTAIDMTPEGGVLKFTGGEYNFSYPLEINKSITILGAGQFNTVLKFNDSSGLEVNADDVQIEGLKVSTNVKYTTTANEYTAFSLIGDRHILRDIVAYGFKVGVEMSVTNSLFDNVFVSEGHKGFDINSLSRENIISKCIIKLGGATGSAGVEFVDDSLNRRCKIVETYIEGASTGIKCLSSSDIIISKCTFYNCRLYGIFILGGTVYSGNCEIVSNSFYMGGSSGAPSVGIASVNDTDGDTRGNVISWNSFSVLAGSEATYAIAFAGTYDKNNIIVGNTATGFETKDILASVEGTIVCENVCTSDIATNISGGYIVTDNVGELSLDALGASRKLGGMSETYSPTIPSTGTYKKSDIVWKTDPAIVAVNSAGDDIDFPIIIRSAGTNIPLMQSLVGNILAPQWAVNDVFTCEGQEFPVNWSTGTPVTWNAYIYTNGSHVTDRFVKFEVEFAWSNPNGVLSSATTQSYEYTIPANTPAKTMLIIPIYTWTPSAGVVGGQVHVRLKRIASTGTSPDNNPWCTKLQLNITTVGGQNYVVNGWRRLTDGSNHVLNTDWAEIRTLSGT